MSTIKSVVESVIESRPPGNRVQLTPTLYRTFCKSVFGEPYQYPASVIYRGAVVKSNGVMK